MTAIVLGIASAAFLGGGLVLTQFGLRYIHPLSGAAISVPSFTICLSSAVADPAARPEHRMACGADLRRRRPGVSRDPDDPHLRVQPRARPGGDRRARQSVAAPLGRGRGSAAARTAAAAAIRRTADRRARRVRHHRHAQRGTARLAKLGAAVAAWRFGAARRDSAGHQDRAGHLAGADRRGPDRLYFLHADGPDHRAHPHRPLSGAGAAARKNLVRAERNLQRRRHAAALRRARQRPGVAGRAALRDLSAVHGRHERAVSRQRQDHVAAGGGNAARPSAAWC